MDRKYAAIDIGSNAARLLIGEISLEEGHPYLKKISYTRLPLRLGEDVFAGGKLTEKKTEDFIKTIKAFRLISEIFQVEALRACATSAMRDAGNGDEVLQAIRHQTGVEIEIISGDEEARLIFGTFELLQIGKGKSFIVIDVGGGSTEINVFEKGKRVAAKSFDIGTVRMLKGRVDRKEFTQMKKWMEANVDQDEHLIFATGGNINKIHKLLGLKDEDPVKLSAMKKLYKELQPLTLEARMDQFHLKPDRADVIIPALEIFTFCLKQTGVKSVFVPKIGLSDGMIYDLDSRK